MLLSRIINLNTANQTAASAFSMGVNSGGRSSDGNGMGIVSAQAAPSTQMETNSVRLIITTTTELALDPSRKQKRRCDPQQLGEMYGHCELTATSHLHSTNVILDVKPEENPIPIGAKSITQSHTYVDAAPFIHVDPSNLPVPQQDLQEESFDYAVALAKKEIVLEFSNSACISGRGLSENETCILDEESHTHCMSTHVIFPLSETPIPTGAISFRQQIVRLGPRNVLTPAQQVVLAKRVTFPKFDLTIEEDGRTKSTPHRWGNVPNALKKQYLDDIENCYDQHASYKQIAVRHGINTPNVRALLRKRVKSIRSIEGERFLASSRKNQPMNYPSPKLGELKLPKLKEFLKTVPKYADLKFLARQSESLSSSDSDSEIDSNSKTQSKRPQLDFG